MEKKVVLYSMEDTVRMTGLTKDTIRNWTKDFNIQLERTPGGHRRFSEKNIQLLKAIEEKAQKILDVRSKYVDSTLADLYDTLSMPPDLLKAHHDLDKSVEKAYGQIFKTDEDRVAFLFEKYQEKNRAELEKK